MLSSQQAFTSPAKRRWQIDLIVALLLFSGTAAVVVWQNSHLAVLWDLSYTLENSYRISLGEIPFRDFPFAHAPITFLIQAAIIKLSVETTLREAGATIIENGDLRRW